MKKQKIFLLLTVLLAFTFVLAACGGAPAEAPVEEAAPVEEEAAPAEEEAAPTEAPVEEEEAPAEEAAPTEEEAAPAEEAAAGITCEEPVKVGLITDETGALAIYGTHILRSFPLGMEYGTGGEGSEGDGYTSYMLENCEIQVYYRDDQSDPENTATVARELI
ncbi:MAG: hypothetical protein AB8I58_06500, partial [Anaerolineales bacterium]